MSSSPGLQAATPTLAVVDTFGDGTVESTQTPAAASPASAATALMLPSDRPDDRGSVAVEVTLLVPVVVALLLFVMAAGRLTSARLSLQEAAHQSARSLTVAALASGGTTTASTRSTAASAAAAALGTSHLPCSSLTVAVDSPATAAGAPRTTPAMAASPAGVTPLQAITVHLTCTVSLSDLTGLALPTSTVITASATSPLDRFRAATAGGTP